MTGLAPGPVRPRVAVIDDSTVIRGGFAPVHPGVEVVATFDSVEAFEAAPPACDVVVLDLLLRPPAGGPEAAPPPGTSGVPSGKQGRRAIRALTAAGYPVCLYSDDRRAPVLALCLAAGASAVVHKSDPPEVLEAAVAAVVRGEVTITHSLVGLTELLDRRGAPLDLSARQRQVISARARGRQWADIGGALFITEDTAREHYRAACGKLRGYLTGTSAGDLERALGLMPGDVLDEG